MFTPMTGTEWRDAIERGVATHPDGYIREASETKVSTLLCSRIVTGLGARWPPLLRLGGPSPKAGARGPPAPSWGWGPPRPTRGLGAPSPNLGLGAPEPKKQGKKEANEAEGRPSSPFGLKLSLARPLRSKLRFKPEGLGGSGAPSPKLGQGPPSPKYGLGLGAPAPTWGWGPPSPPTGGVEENIGRGETLR
uniref:Uncharacterized protein n=1 Tax=Haematococcus lacustris TaxID=44745 RepID=A0A2K9YRM9_HAELA|nr:hypothetical protein SG3EUKT977524.1 [Haematococcus lacustris]AUW36564.1 hypothetical protein SG3EUKT977524.1 [Haematococcus lacustris]